MAQISVPPPPEHGAVNWDAWLTAVLTVVENYISATESARLAHENTWTPAHGGIVSSADSRLTDTRTPKPHAASHGVLGADAIAPADIGAVSVADMASAISTALSAASFTWR